MSLYRWMFSWLFYLVGDVLCRWDNWLFGRWEWTTLYPVYSKLLTWSSEIQATGPGPWLDSKELLEWLHENW